MVHPSDQSKCDLGKEHICCADVQSLDQEKQGMDRTEVGKGYKE